MASFPRILSGPPSGRCGTGCGASSARRRAWRAGVPALLVTLLLAGCPADGDDLQPPRDALIYPTAIALSPDASRLFAVSANSDLRWSSGSVLALDLEAIDDLVSQWLALPLDPGRCQGQSGPLASDACACDPGDPAILSCDQALVIRDGGVRIGNFATDLDVQDLGNGELRLFVPVRGDPSVTWIGYRGDRLTCDGNDAGYPLCDEDRILGFADDPARGLRAEPFDVFVDPASDYAVVTHLQRAAVSLIQAPRDGVPALIDEMIDLFSSDSLGRQAALGVAARPASGAASPLLYVTSRSENRIQMLSVAPAQGASLAQLAPAGYFLLNSVGPSSDSRGIAFNADGTRAYIANRNPPMLHVLDTALTPEGTPRNQALATIELCRDPANLAAVDLGDGTDPLRDTRVYVACFPEGQVWAIHPESGVVEASIATGAGPHALAVDAQRKRLYVVNFLDHSIAVVELDPASPARNQVVLRLRSSQEGDN
jgi:hypothetical protein